VKERSGGGLRAGGYFSMSDIGPFLGSVLFNFWTLVAGVMISIEPVTRFLWRGYDEWAAKWLPAQRRRKLARIGALIAFAMANYLAFHEVREELRTAKQHLIVAPASARHLNSEERVRFATALRAAGGTGQTVEINSASNCDECEEYAEELRETISSVNGWNASGGTTIFGSAAIRGIRFHVRSLDNRAKTALKLASAFDAANIKFSWIEDMTLPQGYEYIILVARQSRP
jgi:hypothetical protein